MKKTLALLLALVMLSSTALFACGDADAGTTTDTTAAPAVTTAPNGDPAATTVPEETKLVANIPEGTNFNDYNFNIANGFYTATKYTTNAIAPTEVNGDVINDAMYKRTVTVEDKIGIKVVDLNIDQSKMKTNLQANAAEFDLMTVDLSGVRTFINSGYMLDFNELPNIDMTMPWWDQNAVNDLTVGERLYMVTGDISIMYKKSIGVLLFNKQMLNDQDLEDPYQLVKDMKWTIDKFNEMASTVSQDVNGDGKYDLEDKYGLLYYCDMIALGLVGGGTHFTTKNAEDYPELTFYTDRTTDIFNKYTELMYNPQLSISWSKLGKSNDDIIAIFQDNRGLFNFNEFHAIENMRQMDTAFGILPMPLYDESQERYYHIINPHVAAMLLVPKDCRDLPRAGYVLDALGAESKNILTPAYYDQYLKSKGTRDNDSEEMLDIIFDSMTYDIGYLYNFGELGGMVLGMVNGYQTDLASRYAKYESKAVKAIEKMVTAFQDME